MIHSHSSICSDNRNCRRGFRPCYNQRCVASSRFCDGIDDCGDNSDEAFCSSELQPFDLLFYPFCLSGQNPVTLMLMLMQHARPHAALSLHCLMSPKILSSVQIKRDARPLPLETPSAGLYNIWCCFNIARGI